MSIAAGPARIPGHGADDGRVSVFIAIAITGLLMVFGAAVDGSGQLRTLMRADNIAAEAARAAGQAIDVDVVAGQGEYVVDEALAADYANRYLTAASHNEPGMSFVVTVVGDGTAVQIDVELPYRNRILGMFGRADVQLSATSTAVLVTGP